MYGSFQFDRQVVPHELDYSCPNGAAFFICPVKKVVSFFLFCTLSSTQGKEYLIGCPDEKNRTKFSLRLRTKIRRSNH